MSIYEQLVKILAEGAGYEAHTQYDLLGEIDAKSEAVISRIDMDLRAGKRKPDMKLEFDEIKCSIQNKMDSFGGRFSGSNARDKTTLLLQILRNMFRIKCNRGVKICKKYDQYKVY